MPNVVWQVYNSPDKHPVVAEIEKMQKGIQRTIRGWFWLIIILVVIIYVASNIRHWFTP
jgi:hypothetical protein